MSAFAESSLASTNIVRGNSGSMRSSTTGAGASTSTSTSTNGKRVEPAQQARSHNLLHKNSFLSMEDVSPSPQDEGLTFVQQQRRAIEQMGAQQGSDGRGTIGNKSSGSASGNPSLDQERKRGNTRGLRLGNQMGRVSSAAASIAAAADAASGSGSAPPPQANPVSKITDAAQESQSPPDSMGRQQEIAPRKRVHRLSSGTLDAIIMDSSHSSESSAAGRASLTTSGTNEDVVGSSTAAAGAPPSSARAVASTSNARQPFRSSRLHYSRDDTPGITANGSARASANWDPSALVSTSSTAGTALRRQRSSQALVDEPHDPNGSSSAATMWARKRASASDLLSRAASATDDDDEDDRKRREADDVDPWRPPARRDLYLPQFNGNKGGTEGEASSADRASRLTESGDADRVWNDPGDGVAGENGMQSYEDGHNERGSASKSDASARLQPKSSSKSTLSPLMSATTPTQASDTTPRPSRDAFSSLSAGSDRTVEPVQDTAMRESVRAAATTSLPGEREQRLESWQQNGKSDHHLSDSTIAQLGALPGMQPTALLNASGQPLSSKNILTIALQKAQSAVLLDSSNNVPEAMLAYRQAVRLLQEVMERVGPRASSKSRRTNREEERRRLKVIHDTYADRIRLLSMIYTPDEHVAEVTATAATSAQQERQHSIAGKGATSEPKQSSLSGLGIRHDPSDGHKKDGSGPTIAVSEASSIDSSAPESEVSFRSSSASRGQHPRNAGMDVSVAPTPTTPYFDFDQDQGAHGDSQPATPSSMSLQPRALHGGGNQRLRLAQDAEKNIQRAPSGGKSLSPRTATATLGAQDAHRASSDGSETSFRQLMTRAQEASAMLLSGTPTSDKRSSDQATPPFDLNSPPSSGSARRRASTLLGRSVSPTEQKTVLVNPSTSTGTISQRRRQASNAAGTQQRWRAAEASQLDAVGSAKSAGEPTNKQDSVDNEVALPTSPTSPTTRKRAMSQPSTNRRPAIPASLMPSKDGSTGVRNAEQEVPPVPSRLSRKMSMPMTPTASAASRDQSDVVVAGLPNSIDHSIGESLLHQAMYAPMHASLSLGLADTSCAPSMADIFPMPLSSMQMGLPPSFASSAASTTMPWLNIAGIAVEAAQLPPMPSEAVLRPYHTMRQLHSSILNGAWITPKLFIPRDVWFVSSTRVAVLEIKVRMLELVNNGIDALDATASYLFQSDFEKLPVGLIAINTSRLLKQLEELDMLMTDVQNTLARKLSFIDQAHHNSAGSSLSSGIVGRKNGSGFTALSSKLSRSLDRMVAQSKSSAAGGSVESPAAYVDVLSRVFANACRVLGEHTSVLLRAQQQAQMGMSGGDSSSPSTAGYMALSNETRSTIETRLRRASEFFARVVMRLALRDVAVLLDKSMKRTTGMLIE